MMRKRTLKSLAPSAGLLLLMVIVLSSACSVEDSNNAGEKETAVSEIEAGPFGKYQETVEVSAARILTSWMKFDEGDDLDNNWWMRTFREELNIDVNWLWTAPNWGEPYEQKVYTSLATNNLPDMMNVYGTIFKKLAASGKLADLSEVYESYASDELRNVMEANDSLILRGGMVDGKLLAIGLPSGFNTHAPAVYIRSDWLEAVGLDAPKNLNELERVALAFVTDDPDGNGRDDTYGLYFDKDLGSLNAVMIALGAVNQGWIEKNGRVEPGRIQPEMKNAWSLLARWYEQGIIAEEFAIKGGNEEARQDLISGKVGIKVSNFSDFDAPEFRDQHLNNPDSDWIAVPLYDLDGEYAAMYVRSKVQDFNVVSAACEHPEAAIKMLNMMLQVYTMDKPDFVNNYDYHVTEEGSLSFFMAPFRMMPPNLERKSQILALEYIKQEKDPADLPFEARDIFDRVKEYEENKNPELWGYWKKIKQDGAMERGWQIIDNHPEIFYVDPVNWTETEADAEYGPDMNSRFKEFATIAIMENDVEQQFSNWLAYWKNNGGEEIVKQNNEQYQLRK